MYYYPTESLAVPAAARHEGAARLGRAIDLLTAGTLEQQRILLEAMTRFALVPFRCVAVLSGAKDAAELAELSLRSCLLAAPTSQQVQYVLQLRSHSREGRSADSATGGGNARLDSGPDARSRATPARAGAWVKTPVQGDRASVDRQGNGLLVRIPVRATDEERSCVAS
jgi:hypothetical protein